MHLIRAFKAFFEVLKRGELRKEVSIEKKEDPAHLRLLALLQKEGRFIDFLQEDISEYSDAKLGAAVRVIHAKCREVLEEFVTIRPILTEEEGSKITIPVGFDPSLIKVTGRVRGKPPYNGILYHQGWKAHKLSLPKQVGNGDRTIVCPAEVEVS